MGTALVQIIIFSTVILMVHVPEAGSDAEFFEGGFFNFSDGVHLIILLAIVLLFVIEAVCVYAISSIVIKPITTVVAELEKVDVLEKINLQETNIKEIDQLTHSIEKMSIAVANSASKISKIINMAQIPIGVFEYEESGSRVFCGPNLVSILGWDKSEYIDSYYNRDVFFKNLTDLEKYWYKSTKNTSLYKIPQQHEDKWIQLTLLREAHGTLGTVTDVSKEMNEKLRIEFERDYDVLTGIFNRRAFDAALDELFEFPARIGIGAFLMFDLDNLKYVNDTYGHEAGDDYIKAMANVLKDFEEFHGIISRRSGDEFNVFLYGYRSKEQVRDIVLSIYKRIGEQSIVLPNQKTYTLMASAGVAYYPYDADNIKLLTTYSDFAMYLVKHSSKGNIQEFNLQDYEDQSYLLTGHEALVRLLDGGELSYVLQPIFDVAQGTVYGYEMLMRSHIKELSSPMEIISMAKSQSKLHQLEKCTWFNAMKTFSHKVKAGKIQKECKVFFNSFGNLILQDDDMFDFVSTYQEYLSSIVLEIIGTEQHVIEYSDAKAGKIRELGGMIALDNFGSGYNNDALLVISSPDLIKVDKNIIHNINEDEGKQQLVKIFISYAKSRNIKIVTEGVETKEEMEMLVSFGVDYLQGYYIGKPETDIVPIDERIIEDIKSVKKEKILPQEI
jgi:diguanylate cyclase (GGDEF)-like protein